MKKNITTRLGLILLFGIFFSLIINYFVQYHTTLLDQLSDTQHTFWEMRRILETNKEKSGDLSYIFSMVTSEADEDIYAIDSKSLNVLASTQNKYNGFHADELGFDTSSFSQPDKVFHQEINHVNSLCIFDEMDGIILASVRKSSALFRILARNTLCLALYVIAISSIALFFIIKYLDRNIIHGIHTMNKQLVMIEQGNLDIKMPSQPTVEMTELSSHINDMLTSLINQQTQLSLILQTVKLPLGTYDYNTRTKQLNISFRAAEILGLSDKLTGTYMDYIAFCKRMDDILASPVQTENNIYLIPGSSPRYVHLEYFRNEPNILGIVMDVTREFQEKQSIKHERDVDLLTSLLSRRAFYRHMEELFTKPEEIKNAAFVMIDSDNLKFVNDSYGHTCGDLYLQSISRLLDELPARKLTARLSGDEFIMIVYGYNTRSELEKLIHPLYLNRDHKHMNIRDCQIPISFSIGCSFYPEEADNYSTLMKIADTRMYEDKKSRKGII